ncbi:MULTISPECIES: helix-turn-helix domain-containing protein [Sphingobacterium]|uniref:helix-turn-helix domain-containing protein n=1 Tax=Sphingobacterium TaxID=28453 RepID=UPI00257D7CB6|nr:MULTISPECIES: helix-turn-helix transcriptional regulator [Sphingobacterium]
MENSIVIEQLMELLNCRAEIASSPPDYVAFPLRGTAWETLGWTSGRLSRQSRKLIGAHLQLIEAELYADLRIPYGVAFPSYFLFIQLRGRSYFYDDQGELLRYPDRPYLALCYYPAGDYALHLGHGLQSFALLSFEAEWFADFGNNYPAFGPLEEAWLKGATTCCRLGPMPLNKIMLDLLDEIRFTAIKGLQDSARVVQLLGKLLQHYHNAVVAAEAAVGRSPEVLRLALDSYLEEHYMDESRCSIRQIKKSLGWTRHTTEQVAKNSLGCTLRRYVLEFRIQKACLLLTETNAKISDIAYQTGFSDLAHFTNSFKRSMGMQPSVYRKKNS